MPPKPLTAPATLLPAPDRLHLLHLRVDRQQIVAAVCSSVAQELL